MNETHRDDLDLYVVVQLLRRSKWWIVSITAIFVICTAAAAWLVPKKYSAVAILSATQNTQSGMGGISSLASQFGGIASLAGIPLRAGNEKAEAIATLQSDILARRYIEEHELLPILFPEKWDSHSGKWKVTGAAEVPTLWQGAQRFKDIRSVTENTKTGLITLSITSRDPRVAAEWADGLVKLTNSYLRGRAIQRAEQNIKYLKEQAAATDIAQLRTSIYEVLESEIKNAMLAKGTEEYALKVIDPPVAPEVHTYPRRRAWLAAGFLAGLFISVVVVLVRSSLIR